MSKLKSIKTVTKVAYFQGPGTSKPRNLFLLNDLYVNISDGTQISLNKISQNKVDLVILYGHGAIKEGVERGYNESAIIDIFTGDQDTAEVVEAVYKRMHPKIFVICGCNEGAARQSLESKVEAFDSGATFIIPSSSKHSTISAIDHKFLNRLIASSQSIDFDIRYFAAKESVINPESLVFMQVVKNGDTKEMASVKFISPKYPKSILENDGLEIGLKKYFTTLSEYSTLDEERAAASAAAATPIRKPHQDSHMIIMSKSNAANVVIEDLIKERKVAVNTLLDRDFQKYADDALTLAALKGKKDRMMAWIDIGGNVNVKDEMRPTALHYACLKGHKEIALALINAGANPNLTDEDGAIPLHAACFMGHKEIALALINAGSNIDALVEGSDTPLSLMNQHQSHNPEFITAVMKAITQRDSLNAAAKTNDLKSVLKLIAEGAEVNSKDSDQMTALHYACLKGHKEIVFALIDAGANPNVTNKDNNTPLHLACTGGYEKVIENLLKNNADPRIENKLGNCPSDLLLNDVWGPSSLGFYNPRKSRDLLQKAAKKATDLSKVLEMSPLQQEVRIIGERIVDHFPKQDRVRGEGDLQPIYENSSIRRKPASSRQR